MTRPNLFIVGQPKSGTSALFSFLKKHPSINASSVKEPQYFCTDFRSQYYYLSKKERCLDNYLSLFDDVACDYQMEASTAYLYSSVAAKNIYAFNPEAKIIIMLREPVDFLYTYHRQLLRNSCKFESVTDFERSLVLEKDRRIGKNLPKGVFEPKFLYYTDRIKYAEQIRRFVEYFKEDQIKIIIYDDFKADNEKVFRQTLEFLNISDDFIPEFTTVNKQVSVRSRVIKQFVDKNFYSVKTFIKKTSGKSFFQWSRSFYRKLIFSNQELPPLDGELKSKLKIEYLGEVEKLSKLLSRDFIREWDYPAHRAFKVGQSQQTHA